VSSIHKVNQTVNAQDNLNFTLYQPRELTFLFKASSTTGRSLLIFILATLIIELTLAIQRCLPAHAFGAGKHPLEWLVVSGFSLLQP